MMTDDMALLREYANRGAEDAFATLVSRHVNLVYSVARRQIGDALLAEEVTQVVFTILARKARTLDSTTILSAWLCRTTRNTSANALKIQRRRRRREHEAYMQSQLNETHSNEWAQIEPLLDAAMAQLGEKDHNAVVLRFFEGRSYKDMSAALGTSEAGAKMRVSRALEKLRSTFFKQSVTLSVTAIAGAISTNSVQTAPIGLATSVAAAAVKGTTAATSTLTLIETTLKLMAWTKFKTAIVIGVIAIMAAGTATVAMRHANAKDLTSAFAFAGYDTPEASIQSMLWAGSRGDFNTFVAACTPDQAERFRKKMAGKSGTEIKQEAIAWASALVGYEITRKDVISDNEVHLHIRATPSAEGLHSGKVVVVMKKIGNEWKQAGDL